MYIHVCVYKHVCEWESVYIHIHAYIKDSLRSLEFVLTLDYNKKSFSL